MPGSAGSKHGFYDVPCARDRALDYYKKQMMEELSVQQLVEKTERVDVSKPKNEP